MEPERWYIAVVVVSSSIDGTSVAEPLVELQYRLVKAASDEEAYRRARELGDSAGHSYLNPDSARVTWQFEGLHDLRNLDATDLAHGFEVYSQLTRRQPSEFVASKDQLTCFWVDANKDRPVRDLLEE